MTRFEDAPVIEIRDLSKRFKNAEDGEVTAVDSITFTIDAGEVVAILGPNGAGKTTTIDMILGLTTPDEGTISVFGGEPLMASRLGRTAAVSQSGGLLGDQTVGGIMHSIGSLHPRANVEACMERANITQLADRQVSKCSGGEQQRLRFALALLSDPDLLILDEPTAGMDVEARRGFWTEIRRDAQAGRTILFATHYLDEVEDFADRIIVVKDGRVIADDTADAIRSTASGCTVSATLSGPSRSALELGSATVLQDSGGRLTVLPTDSDAMARQIFNAGGSDVRITPRSLDEAFLTLTAPSREN